MTTRPLSRLASVVGPTVVGVLACVALGIGVAERSPIGPPSILTMGSTALVVLLCASMLVRRIRFSAPAARVMRVSKLMAVWPVFADIEVVLAMVAGCYAVFAATGGIESPVYPLLYGVIAFSATFQKRAAAFVAVGAALMLELSLFVRLGSVAAEAAIYHTVFIAGAGVVHSLFLRGLVGRLRRDHRREIAREIRQTRDSARDFRLIASALSTDSRPERSRDEEEAELAAGSVEAIRSSILYSLSLLKRSLRARTAILLWLDDRAEKLKIKELVSDSDDVTEVPAIPIAGAVGAVVRDRSLITLANARPAQLPYYGPAEISGAVVGVPVADGAHLRGVLCVDRAEPFEEADAALVVKAAEQIVVAVRSERVFTAVEHAKYEHERFYQASAMLCRALTLEQVMETAFDAAAQIVDYDLGVITLYDRHRRKHRVYSARMSQGSAPMVRADKLAGLEFRANAGLASMVVKNRHYLPATGALRDAETPVFIKRVPLRGAESLLVLPLLSADEAIGTLTLASRQSHKFRRDIREMLSVIANQVAISIQNAVMYKKMETMATTDGLTGLTNHRTFQERFRDLLARSARHGHKAAVLLCDIDHFKSVNDTYGHPVGDEVLRRVAKVLREAVRKIDIPARYGGEEFAVVLEATDLDGAMHLAERIRADVGTLQLDSDKGPFNVTMSIGVAAFPDDGDAQEMLIEHADHALYHAKQTGRNKVVSYKEFTEARSERRAS